MNPNLARASLTGFTPTYCDSAGKDAFVPVGYQDIRYFPESLEPNYLVIAGVNLDQPGQEMQLSTYLGSGENIYASRDNLYVAVTQYKPAAQASLGTNLTRIREIKPNPAPGQASTLVYKFALEQGKTNYRGKGEVPGTILTLSL